MGAILKQRNFLLTKEYELTEKSLKVRIAKPFSFIDDEFTFEQINWKLKRKKSLNRVASIFLLILLVFIVVTFVSHFTEKNGSTIYDMLFYIIPCTIMIGVSYFTFENVVYLMLMDNRVLTFYANSPSTNDVNDFLNLIKDAQKKYLLGRYAKADPYLTQEQLYNNLQWLWDRNIIDDAELNDLRLAILGKKYEDGKSVGFTLNPKSN